MSFSKIINKAKDHITGNQNSKYFWKLHQKAVNGSFLTKAIYNYKYQKYLMRFNSFCPLSAKFADMPVFPHGVNGVFISAGAVIGKGCVIFHQVTIGSNSLPDSKGQGDPTIGDNVYIGAGAKIIGNVTVGDNVRIGANCVVTKDVPDNTTVVPAPVRYITKDEPMDNRFVGFKPNKKE